MVSTTNEVNKQMEDIMNMRYIPAPSSNLSERIIEASLLHKKKGRSGFDLWTRTFWDAFILPKPAYVLASIFVIGIVFGLYSEISPAFAFEADIEPAALVYTAEDISEGDWL